MTVSAEAQYLVWAKRAGGSDSDGGSGIAVLSDGSTLVTGGFSGTATFGPGESGETPLTSAGSDDIFLARYNPDGTLAWAKRAGGSGGEEGGSGIAVLSDGSALVTGNFTGPATFGPGEPGETILTWGGLFVARYNPDGTLAWAKAAGGAGWDEVYAIAALSDGSAFITGRYNMTPTFGLGEPGETTLPGGDPNMFVARYNPDGTLAWAKWAGGIPTSASWTGHDIAVLSDGSTLVTGWFYGTQTFGPGEPGATTLTSAGEFDIFVARYNPDGTLAWAKRAGGSWSDRGHGIAVLSDGSALVTGWFQETATFGPGEPGETTLTGYGQMFVARYNPDGTLAWAKQTAGDDGAAGGYDVAVLSDGSALVAGEFWGTTTFGQGETGETTLSTSGLNDIIIARYNPDGTLAWVRRAGGSNGWEIDRLSGIAVLPDTSAFVTGSFEGTATFGPGESEETALTSAGDADIFVAKFAGTLSHAQSYWSLYY